MSSRFDPFIGIPWMRYCDGIDGADCWGLVRLVYHDLLALDLDTYDGDLDADPQPAEIGKAFNDARPDWINVEPGAEQSFDLVVMRMMRTTCHIGIVTKPGSLLHVLENSTSLIVRYDQPQLARRIDSIYRHPELT